MKRFRPPRRHLPPERTQPLSLPSEGGCLLRGEREVACKLIQLSDQNNVYVINETVNNIEIVIYASTYNDYHIIITNKAYPPMVAKQLLHHMIKMTYTDALFEQYQDPSKYDKIGKIKTDLKETHEIILESIEQILKRGEDITVLQKKAEQLEIHSIKFREDTEAMNSCCKLF